MPEIRVLVVRRADATTNFDHWTWRSHWVIKCQDSLIAGELLIDRVLCLIRLLLLFKIHCFK